MIEEDDNSLLRVAVIYKHAEWSGGSASMLGQHCRRWLNIKTTLAYCQFNKKYRSLSVDLLVLLGQHR